MLLSGKVDKRKLLQIVAKHKGKFPNTKHTADGLWTWYRRNLKVNFGFSHHDILIHQTIVSLFKTN